MQEHYMTVKDAAKMLGLTPRRIRQLIASGDLTAEKLGRDWFVLRDSVDKLRGEKGK